MVRKNDSVRVDAPSFRQRTWEKDNNCAAVSARMILASFGINVSLADIIAGLPRSKTGWKTYEIGAYFLERGFCVRHIHFDAAYPRKFRLLAEGDAEKALLSWHRKHYDRRTLLSIDRFISGGGRITPLPVTAEDLRAAFERDARVMLSVEHHYLDGVRESANWNHAIVPTEVSEKTIWINDPNAGKRSYSTPYLLNATWRGDGALIIERPKNKRPK